MKIILMSLFNDEYFIVLGYENVIHIYTMSTHIRSQSQKAQQNTQSI